jgi:hypothetical protein
MTYQGARAQPTRDETHKVFELSAAHWDALDQISHVRWVEVHAESNLDAGAPSVVPVADVIDALHDGARVMAVFSPASGLPRGLQFEAVEHPDGHETIALASHAGTETHGSPGLHALGTLSRAELDAQAEPVPAPAPLPTHAVSEVALDVDGRVTAVRWGRVDVQRNDWASPQQHADVASVVRALHAGHPVFALFPATHGHVHEREFMAVRYGNGLQTIALQGPSTHEREIHDMTHFVWPLLARN